MLLVASERKVVEMAKCPEKDCDWNFQTVNRDISKERTALKKHVRTEHDYWTVEN